MATRDDIQQIRQDYEDAIADAETARAKALAQVADQVAQKEIIEATGYSRETVRRLVAEGRQILVEEKST